MGLKKKNKLTVRMKPMCSWLAPRPMVDLADSRIASIIIAAVLG